MSIFRKRRAKIRDVRTESPVRDFQMRGPFSSYTPVDYLDYEPFEEFKVTIDDYLEKLLGQPGALDAGNGNTLDNDIKDMAERAIRHLEKQKADHEAVIHSLLWKSKGDMSSFERYQRYIAEQLEKNHLALDEAENRYRDSRFIKKEEAQ